MDSFSQTMMEFKHVLRLSAVVHVFNEKETLISRGKTVLGSGHAKDMFLSSQLTVIKGNV
nr:unnamed protein product [Callosobruchus chinensis]